MKPNKKITTLLSAVLLASSVSAFAADNCDKGSSFGMDTWNFCWDSVFPWRIGGNDTMTSSNDEVEAPPGAHTNSWCKCGEDPYAYYGIPSGYWEPTRIVEVVRHPECSPTQGIKAEMQLKILNGIAGTAIRKIEGSSSQLPTKVRKAANEAYDKYGSEEFLHYHSWPVPDEVLDVYSSIRTQCADMARRDNLETSITDLPWNASGYNPKFGGKGKTRLLMNLYYPEYYLLLDPVEGLLKDKTAAAQIINGALRPLSCAANTTGVGLTADDYGYWLGGCFPETLPTSGHHNAKDTLTATHSILQKSVMHSARTGGYASMQTVHEGIDQVLCNPIPVTGFPKKSHYKFTMLFPYKESEESDGDDNNKNAQKSENIMQGGITEIGNAISSTISDKVTGQVMDWLGVGKTKCAHRFGASKTQWGAKRNSQGDENAENYKEITSNKDHDAAYMVWRWVDCCWE
ncbi:MAG: TraU family protein [Neisseriaceae bacterium]|nr:TraU family protein [Neisseriaceae bacterium]